jgi:uncharacterized LabA/DUF88 family protein
MPSSFNKIALFIDGANLHATAKTTVSTSTTSACSRNSKAAERSCARSITRSSLKIRNFHRSVRFRLLVEAVQRRGVHVTVVSSMSSQPPMIADELRRQADVFTDLLELKSKIGRDPSERAAPREPRQHTPRFLQLRPRWRQGALTFSAIDKASRCPQQSND